MPLDKPTLISTLIQIFSNPDTESNVETIAQEIADAVEVYVKSGQVNVTVATTGSPTNHTGTGTGNIT
ncbi:hypothetical protein NTJ28_001685 [Flavobacterium psychrophilum]|nr:hypothetical protein [Flavobacterium psychrophilum]EKT4510338.1 hypothetical protein [Flavobacterium psychrophilum]